MPERLIPCYEPQLFDPDACDHEALPERSICGTCGFRRWLTMDERLAGARTPFTRDAQLDYYTMRNYDPERHAIPGFPLIPAHRPGRGR